MGRKQRGVVMGVEQGQLLVAVHRIAGVVDVQGDGGRGLGEALTEEVDQRRRQARRLKAGGRILEPAHGRLGTERAATLGRPSRRQLEQRIAAQGIAIVAILVAAGDGQHAETQHRGQGMGDARGIAPVADAGRQSRGQAQPALDVTQQNQAAIG